MTKFYSFWILGLFILYSCNSNQAENINTKDGKRQVIRIIDGDTFVVDDGTEKGEKIRLIGVNTPETRKTRYKDIEYYGAEATAYMKELLADMVVILEYDAGKYDRYGRTLAYVYLLDGTFINAELVKNGYASVMTVPPNVKYVDLFVELEREARESNRGLWGK